MKKNSKLIGILTIVITIVALYVLKGLLPQKSNDDIHEFTGLLSGIIMGILSLSYLVPQSLKYIKEKTYVKYARMVQRCLHTYHYILGMMGVLALGSHILIFANYRQLFSMHNFFSGEYLFGYLALIMFIVPAITGFIFYFIKKNKPVINWHTYSALLFYILLVLHILAID